MKPLIVICGPTASGKTVLGVATARACQGEIISADSRQVYRGMDIGTGKDIAEYGTGTRRVPFHCIDMASPRRQCTVGRWRREALRALAGIEGRGHIPLVVGGTGLYSDALVRGYSLPGFDPEVRARVRAMSHSDRLRALQHADPDAYEHIDRNNTHRVARALEIVGSTDQSVRVAQRAVPLARRVLWIGVDMPQELLHERIWARIEARMGQGMVEEVARLRSEGLSWKRLESFGLEYAWCARFLQGKVDKHAMIEGLYTDSKHYAKRQMTWFRRNKDIIWVRDSATAHSVAEGFIGSRT